MFQLSTILPMTIPDQLEAWRTSSQQRERLYMLAIHGHGLRLIRKRVQSWRRAERLRFQGHRASKHMRDHTRWTLALIAHERRLDLVL